MPATRLRFPELCTAAAVAAALVVTAVLPTRTAAPTVVPAAAATESPVSADALPTTQIDGVAWSQVVAGSTVFVGGRFTTARPAGSDPGEDTVDRRNLLSYNISTGELTSFAPRLNAQARVTALSPDGATLYVGGDFTLVSGERRTRIAAFDVATGELKSSFTPRLDAPVKAIVATATTVYVGGSFTVANGQPRERLAAFTARTGILLGWNPGADANVSSLLLSPNGRRLVVGGSFTELGGRDAYGMGLVGVISGIGYAWAANTVVRNGGINGAITSLSTDGNRIYGTGYDVYSPDANFEGTFAADPETGEIKWIEDCHGDSYDAFPSGGVIFVASHAHDCSTLGGFPDVTDVGHRATVFTIDATQKLTATKADPSRYVSFEGYDAPSLLNWFPDLAPGQFTGQSQAAWNVTGNSDYVVYAGEFPTVNGVGQQGLVRFASRAVAPNNIGPALGGNSWEPTATVRGDGSIAISLAANWDRDDATLTYTLLRDGAAVGATASVDSTFWHRPKVEFVDTPGDGSPHGYLIVARDAAGNGQRSASVVVG